MRNKMKRSLSCLLVLAMIVTMIFSGGVPTAFAADASSYPSGVTYTATARVDESIGLRASASIRGDATGNTAVGITPTETRLIRSNASATITNDSALTITVTPYTKYNLDKIVISAIATISHSDGTKVAVKDIQTFTTSPVNYVVPNFSSFVTSGDTIEVEVVAYADLTYAVSSADYTINLDTGVVTPNSTGSAASDIPKLGTSGMNARVFAINSASAALKGKTIEVTGTSTNTAGSNANAGNYQIYVYNSTKAAADRRVDLILDDAIMLVSYGMTTSNYTEFQVASASNQGNTFSAASVDDGNTSRQTSTTTRTSHSPITIADADVYLTLKGTNILATGSTYQCGGARYQTAIGVDASGSLIVTDASASATLYARGGGCASGIGTGGNWPAGYMEFDGGDLTVACAATAHCFSGIGNGGHYTLTDPGIRGIVINGGKIDSLGFHIGVGCMGGASASYNTNVGKQYVVVTGGEVAAEGSAGSAGAAIGFSYHNDEHEIRIGRPDKGDTDSKLTAVNWGYGAAISGKMTFYSGTTSAYSGQYAAAIGGNAVSAATTSTATTAQAVAGGSSVGGTPLTVYGGNVRAEAGAFTQEAYSNSTVHDFRGYNANRRSITAITSETETRATTSYGAAIGGAIARAGGTQNNIFAGDFTVISSISGAGIGGGGAYSSTLPGGAGGTTWIGTLTDISSGTPVTASMGFKVYSNKDTSNYGAAIGGGGSATSGVKAGDGGNLYIGGGKFTIESGNYGAGIGGGGSSLNGAGGNGGAVAIRGGEFTIKSGLLGAGIGGGGSFSGAAGSGGDVTINVETDTGIIATSTTPSSYLFTIKSGQFGAGIGGGGSISGSGGDGANNLTITGGNFGITAGGNTGSYNSSYGTYSFGAGIGGGGSYASTTATAGDGPTIADISGGYFDVYTMGYGSAIGGGGTSGGTAGECGLIYVTGGTIRAEDKTGASLGTKGLGGGAAAMGTSKVDEGTVIIIGGNVYTTAGTEIPGAYAGQHVWTRPNLGNLPYSGTSYTSTGYAYVIPQIASSGNQNMATENTTQQGQEVGSIATSRIGEQVYAVQYSYPNRNAAGVITGTTNYSDYGINDMYITEEINSSGSPTGMGAVSVWVPAGYILDYDLNGGSVNTTSTNNYALLHSREYAYGSVAILTNSSASYPSDGQTKALVQQGQAMNATIFDGLYSNTSYNYTSGSTLYRELLTHSQATAPLAGTTADVVFVGWSAAPDSAIYEEGGSSYPSLLDEVTFQQADITVYAVWGFDLNSNGIADILESGLELSYNGNAIASGSVTGVPASSFGTWGNVTAIKNSTTAHDPISGKNVVFLGWSGTQLSDAVTVSNYGNTPYSTVLADLYNFGGNKTFTAGGTTYTVPSNGGYIITGDTTLYAVWAIDANANGVPDYLEPTYQVTYNNNASTITAATMPTDPSLYVAGESVALDQGLGLTGLTDSSSTAVMFLYWTANSAASSTIYGIGASASGLLPTETTSPLTIASANVPLYAVWSYDANGNGIADAYELAYALVYTDPSTSGSTGIDNGSGTIQPYPVREEPYYINDTVSTFRTPADPTGWHFEGWTTNSARGGLYTNEAAWNTAFSSYPATSGLSDPVTFGAGNITLYAVWSKDANGNGVADWIETPTSTAGPHYVRYISGSNILSGAGYSLDYTSVPYSNNQDASSAELATLDKNGTLGGYMDGASVPLDLASTPTEANGDVVFLGWSPIYTLANHIYGASSSELQNYIKHLQLIYDIQAGTNNSSQNNTTASHGYDPSTGTNTGGMGYTPESMAGRAYYTRVGASITFDAYYASAFSGYNWNLYNGEGLLNAVVQSPYYYDSDTYSAQDPTYNSAQGWVVYGVWATDSNHNGIADMFENTFTLYYDGNGSATAPVSFVPYSQFNILADQTVTLGTGRTVASSGYTTISRYDATYSVPYIFLGWTADKIYNKGTVVSGDGSVYGFGDYGNLPRIMSAVTFGSMDITVHALWGEDSNRNGIPDIYEGSFSLIYDANGGLNAPVDTTTYYYNDTVTSFDLGSGMINGSYLFMYWTEDSTLASVYGYGDAGILPTATTQVIFGGSNITLYAVWGEDIDGNGTPDPWDGNLSLIYDGNGGGPKPIDSTAYPWGSVATLDNGAGMTHSTDSSYIFVGWTLDATNTYSSVFYAGQQSLLPNLETSVTFATGNITVNAVWSTDLNGNGTADVYEDAYYVFYDANGGANEPADTTPYPPNTNVTVLGQGSMTNGSNSFTDWNTSANGSGATYAPASTIAIGTADETLYAQWSTTGSTLYSLTVQAGTGGSVDTTVNGSYQAGATITITAMPNSNYTFDGWTANNGGTFVSVNNQSTTFTMPASDVIVTASFKSSGGGSGGGSTTYTVTYNANGGTGSDHKVTGLSSGASHTVLSRSDTSINRDHYTFTGWNTKADGSGTAYASGAAITVTASVTLYAQWKSSGGSSGGYGKVSDVLETDNHIVYLNGYPDGSVGADKAITRAEAASIFYRLLKEQGTVTGGQFSDVKGSEWFAQGVNYLASIDILNGYPDGAFRPNAKITRAEFATMAAKFESLSSTNSNVFSDVSGNHWAVSYINSSYSKGWINGYPDGTFRPNNSITRAEVVTIVNAMLDRAIDSAALAEITNPYNDISSGHWAYADIIEASIAHEYDRDEDDVEIWQTR